MADEKDRLGDTLHKKQKGEEDKFFAEQDRQRLARLREQQQAAERAKTLGACPRCGLALSQRKVRAVSVDECTAGHGVWLDAGELEQLGGSTLEERSSILKTVLGDLGILGKR